MITFRVSDVTRATTIAQARATIAHRIASLT
jgi:hypothetical protein